MCQNNVPKHIFMIDRGSLYFAHDREGQCLFGSLIAHQDQSLVYSARPMIVINMASQARVVNSQVLPRQPCLALNEFDFVIDLLMDTK